MALGTVQIGADFELSVSTTLGGTYDPVSDINAFSKNSNRTISQFPVFQRATSYGIPAPREQSYTAGGYLSVGDGGQNALRTAESGNTPVFIKVLFDGTNGFTQEVRVGSETFSAAPDGLQEVTFEFSAIGDAVIVGTGPIL